MSKRKLIQFGVVVVLVAGLATVGIFLSKKLTTKADTLVGPVNLRAILPAVADDVPQDYWAVQYIDAVTRASYGAGQNEPLMGIQSAFSDLSLFGPDEHTIRDDLAVAIVKLKYLSPTSCSGTIYNDVGNSTGDCPYIETAYRNGYFAGTSFAPDGYGNFNGGASFKVSEMKAVLARSGYTTYNPAGYSGSDSNTTTRSVMAAFIAANAGLTLDFGPSVFLSWDFPNDPNSGFDFGYEVFRQKAGDPAPIDANGDALADPLYVQDSPEEGMVEGSDLGMFYDKTVSPATTYNYWVRLTNRDGSYSAIAVTSAAIPSGVSRSASSPTLSPSPKSTGRAAVRSPGQSSAPSNISSPAPSASRARQVFNRATSGIKRVVNSITQGVKNLFHRK